MNDAKKLHFSQAMSDWFVFEDLHYVTFKTASKIHYTLTINEKFNFNFRTIIFCILYTYLLNFYISPYIL